MQPLRSGKYQHPHTLTHYPHPHPHPHHYHYHYHNYASKRYDIISTNYLKIHKSLQYGGTATHLCINYIHEKQLLRYITSNIEENHQQQREREEQQREVLQRVYSEFKLQSFEEWVKLSVFQFQQGGAKEIIKKYKGDRYTMLKRVFPNYVWEKEIFLPSRRISKLEVQRQYLNLVFQKLKLKTMNDWKYISTDDIQRWGGRSLLKFYSFNIRHMLQTIYASYPWSDSDFIQPRGVRLYSLQYFKTSLHNQRMFLEVIFQSLQLCELGEFISVHNKTFIQYGGKSLFSIYQKKLSMLKSIYSNYPWNEFASRHAYFDDLINQRSFMNRLFEKLKLSSLDDWSKLPHARNEIVIGGGRSLLVNFYDNNIFKMLRCIYPNYPFTSFIKSSIKLNDSYHKLLNIRQCYHVSRKEHWYRIPLFKIHSPLLLLYPSEKWNDHLLRNNTNKRSDQWYLYSSLLHLFSSSHSLLENYKHPKLIYYHSLLEFDIFIPTLNIAVEYQGQHHYDDLRPFHPSNTYQLRDQAKTHLAYSLSIELVLIPYWWDRSLSSLSCSFSTFLIR